jgi:hypothetical protein
MTLTACLDCGRPSRGSRCSVHTRTAETLRQARQPSRVGYSSPHQAARRERMRLSGGQCEHIDRDGRRCSHAARETHHLVPLSVAGANLKLAIALCDVTNLRAVCKEHHPHPGGAASDRELDPHPDTPGQERRNMRGSGRRA